MAGVSSLRSMILKIAKLVLNVVTLILYRTGFKGDILGIGGTWNLNEERNPDAEIVASGVLVGFLVYNIVQLISDCFRPKEAHKQLTDVMMSFIGIFLWLAIGGTALHYWSGYQTEEFLRVRYAEKDAGIALGSLCIINGIVYFVDTVLAVFDYYRDNA